MLQGGDNKGTSSGSGRAASSLALTRSAERSLSSRVSGGSDPTGSLGVYVSSTAAPAAAVHSGSSGAAGAPACLRSAGDGQGSGSDGLPPAILPTVASALTPGSSSSSSSAAAAAAGSGSAVEGISLADRKVSQRPAPTLDTGDSSGGTGIGTGGGSGGGGTGIAAVASAELPRRQSVDTSQYDTARDAAVTRSGTPGLQNLQSLLQLRSEMAVLKDLKLGPVLGRGSYGRVHRARWKSAVVAVKIMEQHRGGSRVMRSDVSKRADVAQESLLATTMAHPNVVSKSWFC